MADTKLTMDDLYGPSDKPTNPTIKDGLVYEETPEIVPVEEPVIQSVQQDVVSKPPSPQANSFVPQVMQTPSVSEQPASPASPLLRKRGSGIFKKLVLFAVLFVFGLGVSIQIRPYLSGFFASQVSPEDDELASLSTPTPSQQLLVITPTVRISEILPTPTRPINSPTTTKQPQGTPSPTVIVPTQSAGISAYTLTDEQRQPVGVNVTLPNVPLLSCDTQACGSQGTYLPGGTRLTVAAYTKGPYITDITRAKIVDASGRAFESEVASISGRPAVLYTGNFRGTTSGGYVFTQMRGVMVRVTEKLTVELNHFTPAGLSVDFASDEILFEKIVESLRF